MRRSRSRSPEDLDVVDVLLVEDDEDDAAADEVWSVLHELALEAMARRATWAGEPLPEDRVTVAGPPDPGPVRRIALRYRRRAVTAAVLVVAALGTTAVVEARQVAARAAALAAMPAVLADAAHAPVERWRVPGRVVGDGHDTLLVVDGASLRSVDPGTGRVVWTASAAAGRAAAGGGCFGVDEGLRPDRAPVDDGAGPRGLVACAVGGPQGAPVAGAPAREAASEAPGTSAASKSPVVVVDSATGRTRHTVTVDGELLRAEPVARDLLVTAARADGRVRVTRWDLATGTPRWDALSPRSVLADGEPVAVERRPGSVTVATFAVDLATGEELDAEVESGRPHPYEEHALPGGARATWAWRPDRASGRGQVSGSAARTYPLPGPPLRPTLTDGDDRGVLVVRTAQRERLRGLDLRSGRIEWSRPTPAASSPAGPRATALVDGVMLLDDGAGVTALEVRTGDDLWRRGVDADATDGPALTDGDVVLLPVRDGDVLDLVAHRIADGTVVWRAAAPEGTVALRVVGHRLVAATGAEVIGLG